MRLVRSRPRRGVERAARPGFALAACAVLLASFASLVRAEEPVDSDPAPFGLAAPFQAENVDSEVGAPSAVHTFMMGRLDRLERDGRGSKALRAEGTVEAATYRYPAGTDPMALVDHYARLLEGALVYRCAGRDCGRSSEWANALFGNSLLYGPDARQAYAAWVRDGQLIAVYAVERGNRRVYSHVRVITPSDSDGLNPAAVVARQLSAQHWAVIPDLVPGSDGELAASALAAATALSGELGPEPLWVVCHVGGGDSPELLVAASDRCAATVARALGDARPGLQVKAFGVGPLVPRPLAGSSRVELVLPKEGRW
ncbi:MAG: DUF4892 domain-containing protein [Pseudomonadales bacterium]